MKRILLVLTLLWARPAQAQWLPDHNWWVGQPTFLQQHPVAHALGGVALDGASRFFAGRHHAVKRCIAVGFAQGFWEMVQIENWKGRGGYSYTYAFWDTATAEGFCWLTEGFVHGILKR